MIEDNPKAWFTFIFQFHRRLSLCMLLVFRTNMAYGRRWEARKLWGSLVNSSRSLASLELIAEEIENPFGADPNDLPLESICETIRQSVVEILGEAPVTAPLQNTTR
jgi:predicted membrane chloride channel (bestrophin family)